MKASFVLSSLAVLASSLVSSSPLALPERPNHAPKPAAFFLAGDSTTAIQAANGGGWGNGFLTTLRHGAIGTNYGHNGATTASFVSGGDWARVLAAVRGNKTSYTPYVTIQFGHNDQKPTSGLTVEQYTTNLKNLGNDVRNAGGTPIFVTPLSRRKYDTSGHIIPDLAIQAAATITAATSIHAPYIDLNAASIAYLNAIGLEGATQFNLNPTDFTHLNVAGSLVFGTIVSVLLNEVDRREFARWTVPDKGIARAVREGRLVVPDV